MSIIEAAKKHLLIGLASQVIVSIVAVGTAAFEGFVLFIVGMAMFFPGPKYGPPPDVVVKYGPPIDPTPVPGNLIPDLYTPEGIAGVLVLLGSLLLFAWAVLGWVFWGYVWYIRYKEDKPK